MSNDDFVQLLRAEIMSLNSQAKVFLLGGSIDNFDTYKFILGKHHTYEEILEIISKLTKESRKAIFDKE